MPIKPLPRCLSTRPASASLRFEHDQAHPYGRLEVADAEPNGPGTWRTVFDLDLYNKTQPQPYTIKWMQPQDECLAPRFDRCMIRSAAWRSEQRFRGARLEDGPGDEGRIFHLARSKLRRLAGQTSSWSPTPLEARGRCRTRFPAELHVWKRGTPLAEAPKIYELGPSDSLFEFQVTGGLRHPHIVVVIDAKTYANFQLKTVTLDGQANDLPLPDGLTNFGSPVFTGSEVAVQLATPHTVNGKLYPADTVIAYDLASKRISMVMQPPRDVYLSGGITGTRDGLAIVGVHNLQRVLYFATPKNGAWTVREELVEAAGTTLHVESDETIDGALLNEQGLLMPPQVRRWIHGRAVTLDSAKPEADLSGYTVEIKAARAADGESVNYHLMRRVAAHTGPTPTILHGYGGFGVSDDPSYFCCRFGASWKAWFDRGGAFAIAWYAAAVNAAAAWHLAGAGKHKKSMFDDFSAVAEAADIRLRIHEHLGIVGHSNGDGTLTRRGGPATGSLCGRSDRCTRHRLLDRGPWRWRHRRRNEDRVRFLGRRGRPSIAGTWTHSSTSRRASGPPRCCWWSRPTTIKWDRVTHAASSPRCRNSARRRCCSSRKGGGNYPDEYRQTADIAMQMSFLIDILMKP